MDDPIAADDLSRFRCHNPRCADRGKRGAGNLTACGRYGKRETFRLLYRRSCKARFGDRKGTVPFNARLPTDRAVSDFGELSRAVPQRLADGCGVRRAGRLTKVSRGAAGRLCGVAGPHAKAVHDELVAVSPSDRGGGFRDRTVDRRGPEAVAGEPGGEHGVRRAAQRDGPASQRPQNAGHSPVQQVRRGPRVDDALHDVRLQLLPAGRCGRRP